MANKPSKPDKQFGLRKPSVPDVAQRSGPPAKRSGHVALFLMGTLAVGGGAYALMPSNRCEQPPNTALQGNADCPPRGSSSSGSGGGGSSSHSSFYSGGSSSGSSSSSTSAPGSSSVARGGFGSFGHAVGFSGG
ncbi:MAG: hypothetical protein J0H42_09060 [Rhizobiales bacterium]|nr:hypothetical protein [Hyphomicrobiales bacterium]